MQTNPINNKDIQSKKKVLIIDLPLSVKIFQSIKSTKSFIIKYTHEKQQNQSKRNKK